MKSNNIKIGQLREERELLVKEHIGEFDKPKQYFERLKEIDELIEILNKYVKPQTSI